MSYKTHIYGHGHAYVYEGEAHDADRHHGGVGRLGDNERAEVVMIKEDVGVVGGEATSISAMVERSPVYDYLAGLVWDGVPRLDTWLHRYLGAEDSALVTAYGRTWMVSAARRGLQPGCQCDRTLVLQGPQGARKTTVVRILSRAGVRLPMRAGSTWIMEIGELDAMVKSGRTVVKDYLTQTHDTYRGAYEAEAKTHARTCAFVGTTNDDTFLSDHTGSHSFWVIKIGFVDVDALSADVDQLWAEAVALVLDGGAA